MLRLTVMNAVEGHMHDSTSSRKFMAERWMALAERRHATVVALGLRSSVALLLVFAPALSRKADS